ncbi:MAG: XRE family transcriptional regulator [Candidatus Koribacter versatilis]|uniref:XRE family transcriptional regulator n=1 Tax=Candidatus Korobacter versatilis TaxID=658062 RepID=A0A932A9F6_9BACT|nr:XRE family transcriptional regulator [Candidatus Koribacter versatilis]
MRSAKRVTRGNVLADLGFGEQEVLALELKMELVNGIVRLARQRRYSSRQLERLWDVPQPRVSEIMRGKVAGVSVRRLLWYIGKLGGSATTKVRGVAA